ncbi:myo-inositol-1(or 4)-monophosphatase [Jatrophihabitans endophyticus]|uniref:Inositol-1-monophosphatase n=1 Tax=Jatrophihabitans endophyticus TaxID=1206085 RepID=A0A1M5M6T2_9ACTN|nr:inositol monophosphatase family protein [Jatrophihabitans endophyticus]SHG72463.1 myo-inositol-1(or 4)-monophosphatase [Jatrophihabitans endophyticus]
MSEETAALAALAVELAEGAAAIARAGRAGSFAVDAKTTATDLVTEVDRRVEQWLVERIAAARPGDGVLGEEGGGREGTSGVRWVLDPIDGTVNFVLGIPHYAVSVAAELAGEVVAGAVCNPENGETFRAQRGAGAFLVTGRGAERLRGPRAVPLAQAVVGTGFGYDAHLRSRQAAALGTLLPRIGNIRRLGSAALDLCFLAAGRLDGYFEAGLNAWDHAAGALVAREAGCEVTGRDGGAPSPELVVAAGPELAGALRAAVAAAGADRVIELSS